MIRMNLIYFYQANGNKIRNNYSNIAVNELVSSKANLQTSTLHPLPPKSSHDLWHRRQLSVLNFKSSKDI